MSTTELKSISSISSITDTEISFNDSCTEIEVSDSEIENNEQIFIGNLAKQDVLYNLWLKAGDMPEMIYSKIKPKLTLSRAAEDLSYKLINRSKLSFYNYYGRTLFVDITTDYMDPCEYDFYNNESGKAQNIIEKLKLEELKKTILKFWIY